MASLTLSMELARRMSSCSAISCNASPLVTVVGVVLLRANSDTPETVTNSCNSLSSSSEKSDGTAPLSISCGLTAPCLYTRIFPGESPSSSRLSVSTEPSSTVSTPIANLFINSCLRFLTALYALCTGITLSTMLAPQKQPACSEEICLTKGKMRFPSSPKA